MMRRNETLNEVIEKASGELRIIIEADQVPGGMPTCVFDGRVSEFKMTEEASRERYEGYKKLADQE